MNPARRAAQPERDLRRYAVGRQHFPHESADVTCGREPRPSATARLPDSPTPHAAPSITKRRMIAKLVSGGQTGVDRAALDAALERGVPCGGWRPKGRKAEDGRIPDRYPLKETPSGQRTRWNVRDSDATLVLTWGEPTGGTLLTVNECVRVGRPRLVIDLADERGLGDAVRSAREWVGATPPGGVLDVAGPRASRDQAVYGRARAFVLALLAREKGDRGPGPTTITSAAAGP
jgi:hypothetical protein